MGKRKKKIDITKYEHLFDGIYMVGGLKIKLLEELTEIVEDLLIRIPKLKKEKKKQEIYYKKVLKEWQKIKKKKNDKAHD